MTLTGLRQRLFNNTLLLFVAAFIYFFVTTIADQTQKQHVSDEKLHIDAAYFVTSVKSSIDEARKPEAPFTSIELNNIPWEQKQQTYWIKIVLSNQTDKMMDLVAHFDNPMLDHLGVFLFDDHGSLLKQMHLGDTMDNVPFLQRISPHAQLQVQAKSQSTLYVCILSDGLTYTPINLYQHHDYMVLVETSHLVWGIFLGVAILIALYNLVIYYSLKKISFLLFNGYILTSLMYTGSVYGFGFFLFSETIQLLFNAHILAIGGLMMLFAQLFLLYFLKFNKQKNANYWLMHLVILSTLALLIICLWLPDLDSRRAFAIILPASTLVCFYLLFAKARRSLHWAKLYYYSWIPLVMASAMQPLVLNGYIPYNFHTQYALLIGVLIQIVFMALSVAEYTTYKTNKAIYNATHDVALRVPNKISLQRRIEELLTAKTNFASCLIKITNYHALAPYIDHQKLQQLEAQVIDDAAPLLASEDKVSIITTTFHNKNKLAKVRDGHLMLLVETEDRTELSTLLHSLLEKISKKRQIEGLLIEINIKVGISFSVAVGTDRSASEYIQYSLLAIEQNRDNEDVLHYYHYLQSLNMKEHLSLACDLQHALRENKLTLFHQPQIDLHKGIVSGSEALLRWEHPVHGYISPELFVGIAENTGLINELTRWVIQSAFKQAMQILDAGYIGHKVSINISAKDISVPDFLSFIKQQMAAFNIPAYMIIFELTESVMVSDYEALNSLMIELRKLGIILSIDDYGTGYSSLAYISQLQFDEIKIDKSFIMNLDRSKRNLTIVKTTIEMAKYLNLVVVAEGVESLSIAHRLNALRCDIGQGYHFTKPLPFDQYIQWLSDYKVVKPQSPASTTRSVRGPARRSKPS